MIDTDFIIKYTSALYSTTPEFAPRYDEFRDMFSSGQLWSKEWIIRELVRLDPTHQDKTFVIAGAWFGTLGTMIKWRFPSVKINMLDIDPRCEKFIHNMFYDTTSLQGITGDMYNYAYTEDFIINTSCEHIKDVRGWISLLPKGRTVILQSNNYLNGQGHVNCIGSKEEFIEQTGLSGILYSGSLPMPMYTRFMIIGNT